MDGASRFTQRDAVASILITGINIIAGFLIGVLQHGMDFGHAIETYTVLTIGDGLVTVIPALMISISGGLIVTRTSSDTRLGADFRKQVFGNPQPLLLASGVLLALGAFPGLPTVPSAAGRRHGRIGVADAETQDRSPAGDRSQGCAAARESRGCAARGAAWPSKSVWDWSAWSKGERTLRCFAGSQASGGSWRAISVTCFRRCASLTIFRSSRANTPFL